MKSRLPLLFDHISDLITTILKFLQLKDPEICINSIELLNLTLSYFIQNLKVVNFESNDFFRLSITDNPKVKTFNIESNDYFTSSLTDKFKIKSVNCELNDPSLAERSRFKITDVEPTDASGSMAEKSKSKIVNLDPSDFTRGSLTERKKKSFFEEEGTGGRIHENFENEKHQTQVMNKVWVLILEALRNRLEEENVIVVECCFENYFEIIVEYGGLFSEEIWKELNEKVNKKSAKTSRHFFSFFILPPSQTSMFNI